MSLRRQLEYNVDSTLNPLRCINLKNVTLFEPIVLKIE